mmetsp:Transcript_24948/g.34225  ORF Transcript_24948/g.34225 Transcript_24948/m.34225 type:complete len:213 (-) Transcript_24948:88-726(-)
MCTVGRDVLEAHKLVEFAIICEQNLIYTETKVLRLYLSILEPARHACHYVLKVQLVQFILHLLDNIDSISISNRLIVCFVTSTSFFFFSFIVVEVLRVVKIQVFVVVIVTTIYFIGMEKVLIFFAIVVFVKLLIHHCLVFCRVPVVIQHVLINKSQLLQTTYLTNFLQSFPQLLSFQVLQPPQLSLFLPLLFLLPLNTLLSLQLSPLIHATN